jgi:hypothetical protein
MLDLAARTNSDAVVGIIEEVLPAAPEMQVLPFRTIKGTSYKATLRTQLAGLNVGGFRNVNEGVDTDASTFIQKVVETYFFDKQLEVDEAIVKADDRELGDILMDEGTAVIRSGFIQLSRQFYKGATIDGKGFPGIIDFVNPDLEVDAEGTGDTYSAWALFEGLQGVHIVAGNDGSLSLGDWVKQQVVAANSKKLMAYVNNFSAWLGLNVGSTYSVGRVKNISAAKPLTDKLAAELVSKFPVDRRPTRWFINRPTEFGLRASRSTVINATGAKTSKGSEVFAPAVTELEGRPVVVTDGITAD